MNICKFREKNQTKYLTFFVPNFQSHFCQKLYIPNLVTLHFEFRNFRVTSQKLFTKTDTKLYTPNLINSTNMFQTLYYQKLRVPHLDSKFINFLLAHYKLCTSRSKTLLFQTLYSHVQKFCTSTLQTLDSYIQNFIKNILETFNYFFFQ